MSHLNKKILLGTFLLIFFILIGVGCVSASEYDANNLTSENIHSETYIELENENIPTNIENNEILTENENELDFTSNVTSGIEYVTVQFNGSSNKEITSWNWDFGDGYNGSGQNITHSYEKIGLYNVSLTTTDSNNNNYTLVKQNYISVYYEGSAFVNPDFEEGELNIPNTAYGWTVDDGDYDDNGIPTNYLYMTSQSGYRVLYSNKKITVKFNNKGDSERDIGFGQYIDFDVVDSVTFYTSQFATRSKGNIITVEIGNYSINVTSVPKSMKLDPITIDTSNISGVNFFRVYVYWCGNYGTSFKYFSCSYNNLTHSEFTYDIDSINENNQIAINFTNRGYGYITNFLWDFGDGNTSDEINPTHTFAPGNYTVKLTASNANYSKTYSYNFVFDFPSINGQMYKTMQEAINNAADGDVIDVPMDLSENINIDKNLTLNFNGNKLISSGSSPVIQVTGGAQATIKNITFEGSNVISTDDESGLTITESNIADINITLSTGNIALDGNEFNGSFITVVNTNAVIANNNIANGGIKVNGGKSKINNNVLSGNDVAITQTEGETNITSNIITDNNIGVNVTNGTANINFNVIYSNTNVSLAYVGTVDASNNWFGVIQPSFSTTPSDEYVDVYAPNAEQPAWLVLTLKCNETTLSSAQNYTISVDLTLNSKGENISTLGTLPKFSLPVSTELGKASAVNVENNIAEFTLTTATLTSDEVIFTINGEDYTLDVNVFKVEDRIKELETQLADAQANATKLADDLADANQKVENLTTQLNETQANATKLADELKDANQKAENLTTLLGDAQKQIQTLSADLISTTVAANNLNIKALTNGNIQVTLKANATALANKTVNVIINGVTYNSTTGEDGIAKIPVKFASAGTYYATVTFAGDDTYKSSIGTSKVVVSKKATKITAPKKSFKAKVKTKKVKITLKSGSTVLKSKKITLKVNGKTYTAKTNSKGVATIKVTKLTKKGTFTYTVKFAGDKAYKAITKKGKMTIK